MSRKQKHPVVLLAQDVPTWSVSFPKATRPLARRSTRGCSCGLARIPRGPGCGNVARLLR
jgi:hypothetical protein